MKKFLWLCIGVILVWLGYYMITLNTDFYIDLTPNAPVKSFMQTKGDVIQIQKEDGYEPFEIKGVNMGVGIPGHFATEFAIKKEDYLRWFKAIQEMGANTIRVYTILQPDFYEAVYEYNKDNDNPLYVLHGVWVDDYIQNSHRDAFDPSYIDNFLRDAKRLVDIIHGNRKVPMGIMYGGKSYTKDISPWVIGYILGIEWEDVTVAYTNEMNPDKAEYVGDYMYTTEEATPFEAMLAYVGDQMIAYESERYKTQRLVAFSNWPTTDPLVYNEMITQHFRKVAQVDAEHIQTTEAFVSGTFASYHVYPYYPDYLNYEEDKNDFIDEKGEVNTYRAYLKRLVEHHTIPVVISEFGVPSSRGMAQRDENRGYNQGQMSEKDQGQAIVQSYEDIKKAGCAGAVIFTWQDEWFKRTWNTMHAINLDRTPYWSDYQTNEQYFGLLAFDPGEEESIAYVDGEISEWRPEDLIIDKKGLKLSMKYDEKFIYLLVQKEGYNEVEPLYIPIDTLQKVGSKQFEDKAINFTHAADFVVEINGKEQSRVWVNERYDVLRAMYYHQTHGEDPYEYPPAKDSSDFGSIELILQTPVELEHMLAQEIREIAGVEVYETGKLLHGIANPKHEEFNSLADFYIKGENIEIKIPWQLLNFSDPSQMKIHDDYYEHYGVEEAKIKEMYIGVGDGQSSQPIQMGTAPLKGWGRKVTYHERLKQSYYEVQKIWNPKE